LRLWRRNGSKCPILDIYDDDDDDDDDDDGVIINLSKILEAIFHPLLPDVLLAGGSGEVVSLDVGHCQKSCTSVPSVTESYVVDFGGAASQVSPSFVRQHTPKLS